MSAKEPRSEKRSFDYSGSFYDKNSDLCVIKSCSTNTGFYPGRKLYNFPPLKSEKYQMWVDAIGSSYENVEKAWQPSICEIHFEARFFEKKRLKLQAIPSLHLEKVDEEFSISELALTEDEEFPLMLKTQSSNENEYSQKNETSLSSHENLKSFTKMYLFSNIKRIMSAPCLPDIIEAARLIDIRKDEHFTTTNCKNCILLQRSVKTLSERVSSQRDKYERLQEKYYKLLKGQQKEQGDKQKQKLVVHKKGSQKSLQPVPSNITKRNILNMIDSLQNVNSNVKLFAKLILNPKGKPRYYTEKEKWLCQSIYMKTLKGYEFLRKSLHFNLPPVTSLYTWNEKLENAKICEIDCPFFDNALLNISDLNKHEKDVCIILDEDKVLLNESLTDSNKGGKKKNKKSKNNDNMEIIFDKSSTTDSKSKGPEWWYRYTFIVQSLNGNLRQPLYEMKISSVITNEIYLNKIRSCIEICDVLGLNVNCLAVDYANHSVRTTFPLNICNITLNQPYLNYNILKEVYLIYDVNQLFVRIRNDLIRGDLVTSDGVVSWKVIENLYEINEKEKEFSKKMYPHFTPSHVYPYRKIMKQNKRVVLTEKEHIQLTLEVFNCNVSDFIRILSNREAFLPDVQKLSPATANFIEKLDYLYNIFNGNLLLIKNSARPIERGKSTSLEIDLLETIRDFLKNLIKLNGKDFTDPCYKALAITIESILRTSQRIFKKHRNLEKLNARKFFNKIYTDEDFI